MCKHRSVDKKTCRISGHDCIFNYLVDAVNKEKMCNKDGNIIWYLRTIGAYDRAEQDKDCLTEEVE